MISEDEIKKLGELSRIKLDKEEIKNLQKDLEDILNYFNKLKMLDTSAVDKLDFSAAAVKNEFREDEINHKTEEFEDYSEQMPQKENGYFKVKKII